MDRRVVAFDLEIAVEIPEDAADWAPYRPYGITCAATLTSDGKPRLWHGPRDSDGIFAPRMMPEEARELARAARTHETKGRYLSNRFPLERCPALRKIQSFQIQHPLLSNK